MVRGAKESTTVTGGSDGVPGIGILVLGRGSCEGSCGASFAEGSVVASGVEEGGVFFELVSWDVAAKELEEQAVQAKRVKIKRERKRGIDITEEKVSKV